MRIILTESQYGKLLTEGKLEDLIKKYENDLGDKFYRWYKTQIEEFYEEDPSPTKKYFTWMSKILIDRDIKGLDTDEYNVIEMIKYFDKNIHKFEKKDIYQYTYEELINKYEQAISKVTKKELETSGVEKLYGDEGDRYILVRPKNKEASCKYGSNTKWCIASTSSNYFDNYANDSLFFFVIDRERIPIEGKKKSEAYFKVAIQYNPEKHLKWDQYKSKEWKDTFLQQSQNGIFRFWNAVDYEITSGTVTKYIPKELIAKFIKLIKEYTYKVYLDYYDRMQQSSSTFDKKRLAELKKIVKEKKYNKWFGFFIEGEKERVQNFQGIVIARRGSGINATFRVRKISNGIGVERIFPLYSPIISNIDVVKRGSVRRAKLYYLRGMSERKIRQKTS